MKRHFITILAIAILTAGCQTRYYTMEDFGSVTKIDSHVHIRSADSTFEEQAAADNFVLITLNVDHGDPSDIMEQQEYAALSAERFPGRVFFGPTFFFDTTGWGTEEWNRKVIEQLGKDMDAAGVITVKIWKNIGMTVRDRSGTFIMADDPGMDPVINFIKSKGLPITAHLGEPRNCWLPIEEMTVRSDSGYFSRNPQYHMYLHPDYPSYEDQIAARDHILEKHTDLTFIGCHLGSLEWNVDSLALRLDRYPNFAVDISARTVHLQYQSATDRERVRNFIIKYQDRLLYGTDVGYSGSNNPEGFKKQMHNTWLDDWKYFATDEQMSSDKFRGGFTGLKLPVEVIDKLYRENAIKWYRLTI